MLQISFPTLKCFRFCNANRFTFHFRIKSFRKNEWFKSKKGVVAQCFLRKCYTAGVVCVFCLFLAFLLFFSILRSDFSFLFFPHSWKISTTPKTSFYFFGRTLSKKEFRNKPLIMCQLVLLVGRIFVHFQKLCLSENNKQKQFVRSIFPPNNSRKIELFLKHYIFIHNFGKKQQSPFSKSNNKLDGVKISISSNSSKKEITQKKLGERRMIFCCKNLRKIILEKKWKLYVLLNPNNNNKSLNRVEKQEGKVLFCILHIIHSRMFLLSQNFKRTRTDILESQPISLADLCIFLLHVLRFMHAAKMIDWWKPPLILFTELYRMVRITIMDSNSGKNSYFFFFIFFLKIPSSQQ